MREHRTPLAERKFRSFMDCVEGSTGALCGHDAEVLRAAFYAGLFSVFVMLEEGEALSDIREEFRCWTGDDHRVRQ